MKQITFIGVLTALVGVLVNLTSNVFQRLIGETVSIWPALLLVLATIAFSVIATYIQSGRPTPKLGDVNWSFTFQGLAIVIAMTFGAWQLAGPNFFTGSILSSWGVMAGLPLAVAFLITSAEREFRAGLLPRQQTTLTYEKFFGAYIAAFIGQFFALVGLLILDVILGVWQGWPTPYKFVFWFASQLAIVLLALRGTSVAVKYWQNVVQRDPNAKGKTFGTLVLALAFPFFVYPVIVVGIVLVLPTLRSYPILIVGLLVIVLIMIGREMSKDKNQ